jgi:hypothetical protein
MRAQPGAGAGGKSGAECRPQRLSQHSTAGGGQRMACSESGDKTSGRISAKRLLPAARAAGYAGSDRNFRRLVAEQKQAWRRENHAGRRPVRSPGSARRAQGQVSPF